MTLDQWARIAEIIAAIAVVVSLVYLAVQMRQNTIAVRLNTAHSVTNELQGMFSLIASDESLAEVFAQAATEPELPTVARIRFHTFMGNFMRVYENAYLQKRAGAIDEAQWEGISRMIIDCKEMAAFCAYWKDRKHWFSNDFQKHMETVILPAAPLPEINIPGNYSKRSHAAASAPENTG